MVAPFRSSSQFLSAFVPLRLKAVRNQLLTKGDTVKGGQKRLTCTLNKGKIFPSINITVPDMSISGMQTSDNDQLNIDSFVKD